MSNQSDRNTPVIPLTRAQKRAAKRARQAAWRTSAAGKRHAANLAEARQARGERIAGLPASIADRLNQ